MKIWILENGTRSGPHEDYDIRDRISNNELNAETPAWYDGADGWITLADVPAFSSCFNDPTSLGQNDPYEKLISELAVLSENNSSKKPGLYPIRRFFARMLDIMLYGVLIYIVKVKMGINPLDQANLGREILFLIPYLVLDAAALTYIGTTPGKWLLNVTLRDQNRQKLSLVHALIRSSRVWILGFAMYTPFVLVSLPLSWFMAHKYGKFIWDLHKKNIIECESISGLKIAGYILVILAASSLLHYTVPPEFLPTLENLKALTQP